MIRWMILGIALAFSGATYAQGCADAPVTTDPDGPVWQRQIERSGDRANMEVWRLACSPSEVSLAITFRPTQGNIFLCSSSFDIIQDGSQNSNFALMQDVNNPSSFCDDLLVDTTFIVGLYSSQTSWDTFGSFQLVYDSDQSLNVGAYDPDDYFDSTPGQTDLQGALSGSWYDPSRTGEGLVLEFASASSGNSATVYWFTHRDGEPYWLIGNAGYTPGTEAITVDLVEVSGANFGADFDPDDVQSEPWGAISLEFDSCTSGYASWEHNGSLGSGDFDLERITASLAGIDCE